MGGRATGLVLLAALVAGFPGCDLLVTPLVEGEPPRLVLDELPPGSLTPTAELTGRVIDDHGVRRVTILRGAATVREVPIDPGRLVRIRVTLPLDSAADSLMVEAEDRAGNVARARIRVPAHDTLPPAIHVLEPMPDSVRPGRAPGMGDVLYFPPVTAPIRLRVQAEDPTGVERLQLHEGAVYDPFRVVDGPAFDSTFLPPRSIDVFAYDSLGTRGQISLWFPVDTIPPVLRVAAPTLLAGDTARFRVSGLDRTVSSYPDGHIDRFELRFPDGRTLVHTVPPGSEDRIGVVEAEFVTDLPLSADGAGRVDVTAIDRAGLTTVHELRIQGAAPPFEELVAGDGFTCGRAAAGAVWCWGANDQGQLGRGMDPPDVHGPVAGGHAFVAIAAGSDHVCGVDQAGAVFCWGDNERGQLGDGTRVDRSEPVAVSGGLVASRVDAGLDRTCAEAVEGRILCWGANDRGQLGIGSREDAPVPAPLATADTAEALSHVVVGFESQHSCAYAGTPPDSAYCWGASVGRDPATGNAVDALAPVPSLNGEELVGLWPYRDHTLAVRGGDFPAVIWWSHELGLSETSASGYPLVYPPVSVGGPYVCEIRTITEPDCLAMTSSGAHEYTWNPPWTDPPLTTLAVGHDHVCVVRGDGSTYCSGADDRGQLGQLPTSASIP